MRKRERKKIFLGILLAALAVGAGLTAHFFLPQEKAATIKIYFFKSGNLFAVERPLKVDKAVLKETIAELLSGPTEEEKEQGVTTQLPKDIKALGFKLRRRTAIINFNRKLEACSGGSARLQGMVAQIVYTATEIPGIDKVWIWIEGEKEVVLGGEGLVLDHPLSRREIEISY